MVKLAVLTPADRENQSMSGTTDITTKKTHRNFMMVTDLIMPALLLAIFPFVMPLCYAIIPIFVVAMFISQRHNNTTLLDKTVSRRVYQLNTTTTRAYDYERNCVNSVSQLFMKFSLPPITTNDSTILFSMALNYGFAVRVDNIYYSHRRQTYGRAVCFSHDFSHVWVEEIIIHSYSDHRFMVKIPFNRCFGKKQWKHTFCNYIEDNILKSTSSKLPTKNDGYYPNIRFYPTVDGIKISLPFGARLNEEDVSFHELDSKKECLKFVSDALKMQHHYPLFDPLCDDNMKSMFMHVNFYEELGFGFYNQCGGWDIVSAVPDPDVIILFSQNPENRRQGHVSLIRPDIELRRNTNPMKIPWMHLDGRPRQRRKPVGKMGQALNNAKQPLYSALEDTAINNQILEDQIDTINLQAELIEAQNNLNNITNPPPPPGPIIHINYQCPQFQYRTIKADGRILLLFPFLLATIVRFGLPFIYWSSSLDSFIIRLFTTILLLMTTTLFLAFHYYNHYTTLHIVSPKINMSNVQYRSLIALDCLFGLSGVLYSVLTNSLPNRQYRYVLLKQLLCLVTLSLEMFIDFYISFIFFRLFTLILYLFIFLMEGDSSLGFSVMPTGVTVDVDHQDDLRPDVFQVNKYKYQRRIVQVRIDSYSTKHLLYSHSNTTEVVDLEVFAQLCNAHFDRFNNNFADMTERMTRFISTCTTINRRKDIYDRFPTIDSSTVAFALQYIKFSRSKSALCRHAAETLNL